MPIIFVAISIVSGGLTMVLLWNQGIVFALLTAPFVASLAAALSPLFRPRKRTRRVQPGQVSPGKALSMGH